MRVVMNGLAALKPKTGVGHYVARLHAAMGDAVSLYPGEPLGRLIAHIQYAMVRFGMPFPGRVNFRSLRAACSGQAPGSWGRCTYMPCVKRRQALAADGAGPRGQHDGKVQTPRDSRRDLTDERTGDGVRVFWGPALPNSGSTLCTAGTQVRQGFLARSIRTGRPHRR